MHALAKLIEEQNNAYGKHTDVMEDLLGMNNAD